MKKTQHGHMSLTGPAIMWAGAEPRVLSSLSSRGDAAGGRMKTGMAQDRISTFGELLRRYRLAAGLTQEELAERALISVRAISDLERGVNRSARRDTVRQLAGALELEPDERRAFERVALNPERRDNRAPVDQPASDVAEIPRTFLIADVRGYTPFTVEHGDAAAARLATRFAELTEEVVSIRGGRIVELRGDEVLVAFSSARQALRAAVEMQERFAREAEAQESFPLKVGIGLDTGEAIAVKGG